MDDWIVLQFQCNLYILQYIENYNYQRQWAGMFFGSSNSHVGFGCKWFLLHRSAFATENQCIIMNVKWIDLTSKLTNWKRDLVEGDFNRYLENYWYTEFQIKHRVSVHNVRYIMYEGWPYCQNQSLPGKVIFFVHILFV